MERNEIIENIRKNFIETINSEIEIHYDDLSKMLMEENKKEDALKSIWEIGKIYALRELVDCYDFNEKEDGSYWFSQEDLEVLLENSKSIGFMADLFRCEVSIPSNKKVRCRINPYFYIYKGEF